MSKAIFLSAGGDPFISMFVLKLFKERFYDEVDKFYICYNNHAGVPLSAAQEFISRAIEDPKVELIYHNRGIGNGKPITEMLRICNEDLIMLLEDDGWIFTPGKVSWCFQQIESDLVDAVGSPRFSCGAEIGEAMKQKYTLDYSGYGDRGCFAWPNFFFCKREDLLKTDLDFGSKKFSEGEFYPELNHTMKETQFADTYGWAVCQMRHNGLRLGEVPQYHVSPTEIEDKENGLLNWYEGQTPYWYHVGSLSSGWGGYLSNVTPDVSNEGAKMEIETRVAGWSLASEVVSGFEEFKKEYRAGIEQLIVNGKLDRDRINAKIKLYKELMKVG